MRAEGNPSRHELELALAPHSAWMKLESKARWAARWDQPQTRAWVLCQSHWEAVGEEKGTFVEVTGDVDDFSCTVSSPKISCRCCWEGSKVTVALPPTHPRVLKCRVEREHFQAVTGPKLPTAADLPSGG